MQRILFLILILYSQYCNSQKVIILYNEKNPTANIIYQEQNKRRLKTKLPTLSEHPKTGYYTPTHYSNGPLGIAPDVGFSDYIYIPTQGKIKPGKQYTLKAKLKFDSNYDDMPFFQDNFGIALTSHLYPNKFPSHWGLWQHTNESVGTFAGEEIVSIEQEFRPLCTSDYLVLGVFKNDEKDPLECFLCYYPFELHELSISESQNPEKAPEYFCDEFKESDNPISNNKSYQVYFDHGSYKIQEKYKILIDSIVTRLKDSNDLIALTANTDISGDNNEQLGLDRNNSVKQAMLARGIDSSRFVNYNLADSKASKEVVSTDRRVDISFVPGRTSRIHYSKAIESIKKEEYALAHKILLGDWLKTVPPNEAIIASFDCWDTDNKSKTIKNQLEKAIKTKFYRKNNLAYTLDSIRYEYLKGRRLVAYLQLLKMPGTTHQCDFTEDGYRDSLLRVDADRFYADPNFPPKELKGAINNLAPIIFTSNDTSYLDIYLPIFKKHCENRSMEWRHYATLYDKIQILKTGFQRYGTYMITDNNGQYIPGFPLENNNKIDEYRRQVKLAPFNKNMKAKSVSSQSKLDKKLIAELTEVYYTDQQYRSREFYYKRDFKKMKEVDSLNLIKVKRIIDERGWLGPDIIGVRGSKTLFLVIQHSDLETQLKYIPLIREAVKNGNADPIQLAYLEDRIAMGQDKKQLYGTQVKKDEVTGQYYLAPLKNPTEVNKRRSDLGLGPIENYIKKWDIDWEKEKVSNRHRN